MVAGAYQLPVVGVRRPLRRARNRGLAVNNPDRDKESAKRRLDRGEMSVVAAHGRGVQVPSPEMEDGSDQPPVALPFKERLRRLRSELAAARSAREAEREEAREALRRSEERLRILLESMDDCSMFLLDAIGRVASWNLEAERLTGFRADEIVGRHFSCLFTGEDVELGRPERALAMSAKKGRFQEHGWRLKRGGSPFWAEAVVTVLRDRYGEASGFACVIRDRSEIRQADGTAGKAEEQLRRPQRLEAVGMLAAGVAHDFGNLLTAIMSCSELVVDRLREDDPLRREVRGIKEEAMRAAGLTRQLLAYCRREASEAKVLDVNAVVGDMGTMLRRLIGEGIELVMELAPNLGQVRADAGQVEQVIMNLALNARDAMPEGGRLKVETANVELARADVVKVDGCRPGPYVLLAVGDTGCGISPGIRARIFEPFFTTKAPGQGTGLGLATVREIVTRGGGYICVDSEAGRGTTFRVYLPRAGEAARSPEPKAAAAAPPGASETLLLVEDDYALRRLTRAILQRAGYRVLEAAHGFEAVKICEAHDGPIQLVVTDVAMPQMSGHEVADRVARVRPEIKVLYMSGYGAEVASADRRAPGQGSFLEKPFTPESLIRAVRDLLDRPSMLPCPSR